MTLTRRWRLFLLAGLGCGLILFMVLIKAVLIPFLIALVLAYILEPFIDYLEHRGMGRIPAILVNYLMVAGILTLAAIFGLPPFWEEIQRFGANLPQYTRQVENFNHWHQQLLNNYALPQSLHQVINEIFLKGERALLHVMRQVAAGVMALFSHALSFLLAPLLAFYLLKDAALIRRRLVDLLPVSWRPDLLYLGREIDRILKSFIKGNLLIALIVGSIIGLATYLFGLDFALLIAIISGIAEIIPYFGPLIGAIPVLIMALMKSKLIALYLMVIILLVHQLEGNVLTPWIMGESVGLHPLTIVFALLVGGELLGVVGLLIAVPLAAVIRVIANYLFLKIVG